MSDPFNFDALQKCTPKYLGMDSLKEALNEDEHQMEVDGIEAEIEDVSMSDQVLVEHEKRNESSSTELPVLKPIQADQETKKDMFVEKEHEPSHSALLHTVIAPTQAGAQQALHSDNHSYSYNYEVSMPIPPPWHKNMGYTLSTYLQCAFNLTLVALFAWLIVTVRADVNKKISERQSIVIREAEYCHTQYVLNNCRTGKTPPHLVENRICLELEQCMDADPNNVRWLSMYASLVAEIANELIIPLQLRTIVSLLCFVVTAICVVGANYWFGFWRAKTLFQTQPHIFNDGIKVLASSKSKSD